MLFSSEPGLGGVTCAQLFMGTSSKLNKVFGMKIENEGPDAFEDFIRDNGVPYALRSDNAEMQTGVSFRKICVSTISGLRTQSHRILNRIQQKGTSKMSNKCALRLWIGLEHQHFF
eukprot:1933898-Ditylum_brightwellii.AAC.1